MTYSRESHAVTSAVFSPVYKPPLMHLWEGTAHGCTYPEEWSSGATLEVGYHTFHNLKITVSYSSTQDSCNLTPSLWKGKERSKTHLADGKWSVEQEHDSPKSLAIGGAVQKLLQTKHLETRGGSSPPHMLIAHSKTSGGWGLHLLWA